MIIHGMITLMNYQLGHYFLVSLYYPSIPGKVSAPCPMLLLPLCPPIVSACGTEAIPPECAISRH